MRHLTFFAVAALVALGACAKSNKSSDSATSAGAIAPDTAAGKTALRVADVTIGRHVDATKKVTDATDTFTPRDSIFASVHTSGAASAKLTARWTFQDGQVVDERSETITGKGDDYTEFHIAKPGGWPAGKYTLHVLIDGNDVQTKDFTVK